MDRIALALVAVVGVPLATAGYLVLVERALALLPDRRRGSVRPWLWLAPALALLLVFLVYPTLQTIVLSFYDASSTSFVGLRNFAFVFTDAAMLGALRNNLIWLVIFTGVTVTLGLVVAVLTD